MNLSRFDLSGKVATITGAAAGIGLGIARQNCATTSRCRARHCPLGKVPFRLF
jgi:hypothetical protein